LRFQVEIENLKKDLHEAKRDSPILDENSNEHVKLKLALSKVNDVKKDVYLNLGFNSGEEYARTLYYLTHITRGYGRAPKELIHLFGFPSISMVQKHLRDLGLNKKPSKGMDGKKQRGSQNYEKTYHVIQSTRRKAQLQNYSGKISKPEEFFRREISDIIYTYFLDSEKYEIVVGVNNTIKLEIDIPIIIYIPKTHQIFRFAIEYNGPQHSIEKDARKKNHLKQRGWVYIEIQDIPKYSNNLDSLRQKVHETCAYIKKIVDTETQG